MYVVKRFWTIELISQATPMGLHHSPVLILNQV
jgi:hypothetical protein